jgi:hypothetical protein
MKPTPTHYFIFIRPPDSWTWTLYHSGPIYGTPWRSGDVEKANKMAQQIAEHSTYCAIVKGVELPQEKDAEQYALFADGDTMYMPTKPHLISKQTNEPK